MRKKAEKAIREAVKTLDSQDVHRLDQVRMNAGLHRKVFDKTILDMARVGTIMLYEGSVDEIIDADIRNLVRQGETVYLSFSFTEIGRQAETEAQTTDILIRDLDQAQWDRFSHLCRLREDKGPAEKIKEMILEYNRQSR